MALNRRLMSSVALGRSSKSLPLASRPSSTRFTGGNDGGNPGKLIQGGDGNFYGIASYPNIDNVFKVTPAGVRNTLYRFEGTNGREPSQLIASTDGNVYGTTQDGGIPQAGSIFGINPAGQVTAYIFDGTTTGGHPSQLFEGEQHNLYGTNATGGANDYGTIFRLNMAPPRNLLNISTRSQVLTDDKVLIGGFIITGSDPKRVIIRGIGPSLIGVGATLRIRCWSCIKGLPQSHTTTTGEQIRPKWKRRGIPPTNDLESAIVTTLAPGAYTAILKGKNNGTGVGVVEVYDLDQAANSKLANISTRGFVDTGNNVMIGGLIVSGGAAEEPPECSSARSAHRSAASGLQGAFARSEPRTA